MRTVSALAWFTVAVAVVGLAAGCGSSNDSPADAGASDSGGLGADAPPSTTGTGGAGGAGVGAGATGGRGGGGDAAAGAPDTAGMACFNPKRGGGTCTMAELAPYNQCIAGQCQTIISACYGVGAFNGSFGGACGSWMTCVSQCGCGAPNLTCIQACGAPSLDCAACGETVDNCEKSSGCVEPACLRTADAGLPPGGGTDTALPIPDGALNLPDGLGSLPDGLGGLLDAIGGGGTCADLLACCQSIADATQKSVCLAQYANTMQLGDGLCGVVYQALKAQQICK